MKTIFVDGVQLTMNQAKMVAEKYMKAQSPFIEKKKFGFAQMEVCRGGCRDLKIAIGRPTINHPDFGGPGEAANCGVTFNRQGLRNMISYLHDIEADWDEITCRSDV
jgi:hypothetical protein